MFLATLTRQLTVQRDYMTCKNQIKMGPLRSNYAREEFFLIVPDYIDLIYILSELKRQIEELKSSIRQG